MNSAPSGVAPTLPALESVLCTEELNRRPSRPPDYERESRALGSLAQALADSPRTILQALADTILEVFRADSAGISLVTEDGEGFHWPAIAGVWKPHIGGGTPRDFSPCGDVLDRDCPLLFRHFERRYTYFLPVTPPVEECLLVPFYVEGKAVGTIWAIAHDDRRKFDSEDLRMLVSLGTFASTAYQAVEQLHAFREQTHKRQEAQQAMREMNQALLVSSVRQHELTEQAQKAEAALWDSTELLRQNLAYTESIVATVREPLLVLDKNLRVLTASRSFYETYRAAPEETIGRLLYDLGNGQWNIPELRRLLEEILPQAIKVEEFEVEHEFEHIGKKTMLLNGRRLVQEGDRAPSILLALEDVTERKRQANQLRQYAAELSATDHRKDEFLAMLAHELRNPLAPLHNAVLVLKTGAADPEAIARARDMMERQIQNMTRLIDDLLDVSRINQGKVQLRKEPVELVPVLTGAAESAEHQFRDSEQELAVSLPSEPIYLEADPTRLAQIFGNLLNNASKYNNRGGHVWLTAELASEGRQSPEEAVIRVRDDGIGVAPDQLPHIFDLFTQVDHSLERSQGGLGIGLTLVKNLVEMHGGTVVAQSVGLGRGSEFVVRLPVVAAPSRPRPTREADNGKKPALVKRRILVVDDNLDSAESLAMLLGITGHEVQTAHDGEAAVAAAETFRPEVVLLDIGLPKLNGYEAAHQIRQQPWGRKMALVALTGWGQEEDRRKSKQAGFDNHLVKPVDYAALVQLLAELRP
jgi:signal transduction histidine kinase